MDRAIYEAFIAIIKGVDMKDRSTWSLISAAFMKSLIPGIVIGLLVFGFLALCHFCFGLFEEIKLWHALGGALVGSIFGRYFWELAELKRKEE